MMPFGYLLFFDGTIKKHCLIGNLYRTSLPDFILFLIGMPSNFKLSPFLLKYRSWLLNDCIATNLPDMCLLKSSKIV